MQDVHIYLAYLSFYPPQVSSKTAKSILRAHESGQEIKSSKNKPRQKCQFFSNVWLKEELALKIHSYHKENKFFTLDNLLHFAKEEVEYTAGRTTLYKILKSMGYRYKKVNG
jgi:transposase